MLGLEFTLGNPMYYYFGFVKLFLERDGTWDIVWLSFKDWIESSEMLVCSDMWIFNVMIW